VRDILGPQMSETARGAKRYVNTLLRCDGSDCIHWRNNRRIIFSHKNW